MQLHDPSAQLPRPCMQLQDVAAVLASSGWSRCMDVALCLFSVCCIETEVATEKAYC